MAAADERGDAAEREQPQGRWLGCLHDLEAVDEGVVVAVGGEGGDPCVT